MQCFHEVETGKLEGFTVLHGAHSYAGIGARLAASASRPPSNPASAPVAGVQVQTSTTAASASAVQQTPHSARPATAVAGLVQMFDIAASAQRQLPQPLLPARPLPAPHHTPPSVMRTFARPP
jgi:hypothetical protein